MNGNFLPLIFKNSSTISKLLTAYLGQKVQPFFFKLKQQRTGGSKQIMQFKITKCYILLPNPLS